MIFAEPDLMRNRSLSADSFYLEQTELPQRTSDEPKKKQKKTPHTFNPLPSKWASPGIFK